MPVLPQVEAQMMFVVSCSAYKFRVTVFCPWTNKIEVVEATDPYSRCTTGNGERSLFVDLHSPALMPPGWWEHPVPRLVHWTDVSVYELHIRDFRWGAVMLLAVYGCCGGVTGSKHRQRMGPAGGWMMVFCR